MESIPQGLTEPPLTARERGGSNNLGFSIPLEWASKTTTSKEKYGFLSQIILPLTKRKEKEKKNGRRIS